MPGGGGASSTGLNRRTPRPLSARKSHGNRAGQERRAVEYNRRWRERNRDYVERYNLLRRTPPARLVCSECGAEFFGRKDRKTCSNECRRRRKVRLDPRWEPGRRGLGSGREALLPAAFHTFLLPSPSKRPRQPGLALVWSSTILGTRSPSRCPKPSSPTCSVISGVGSPMSRVTSRTSRSTGSSSRSR